MGRAKKPLKGRVNGRPTKYEPVIAETICREIADGRSLRKLCERDDMPGRETVRRWLQTNRGFRGHYARARRNQADALIDEAIEAAREAQDSGSASAARVKVDAFFKLAGQLRPKVYGDRSRVELTGKGGGPMKSETESTVKVEFDHASFTRQWEEFAAGRMGGAVPPANDN